LCNYLSSSLFIASNDLSPISSFLFALFGRDKSQVVAQRKLRGLGGYR
jgi:hypothetical protein